MTVLPLNFPCGDRLHLERVETGTYNKSDLGDKFVQHDNRMQSDKVLDIGSF